MKNTPLVLQSVELLFQQLEQLVLTTADYFSSCVSGDFRIGLKNPKPFSGAVSKDFPRVRPFIIVTDDLRISVSDWFVHGVYLNLDASVLRFVAISVMSRDSTLNQFDCVSAKIPSRSSSCAITIAGGFFSLNIGRNNIVASPVGQMTKAGTVFMVCFGLNPDRV